MISGGKRDHIYDRLSCFHPVDPDEEPVLTDLILFGKLVCNIVTRSGYPPNYSKLNPPLILLLNEGCSPIIWSLRDQIMTT